MVLRVLLAIVLGHALQDFRADALVIAVIRACDPEAQDIGTRLLDDALRRRHVAERFRHFPALLVEREAVGQHNIKRRAAARAAAFKQARLEPAAMLVRALEIHHAIPPAIDHALHAGEAGKFTGSSSV